MTTPQTPKGHSRTHGVKSSPPTSMATRKLQDFIFDIKDDLPSGEYKEMIDNCGKLYNLEMSHDEFANKLSCLSSTSTTMSTPLHVSKQLHDIHILNQHVIQARQCSLKFKTFLKFCKSKENISWNTSFDFEGQENTMKSFFKNFVDEYKFHKREANILRQNIDPNIINQLQSLPLNLYYLTRNLSK